jgi:hypothetical protein
LINSEKETMRKEVILAIAIGVILGFGLMSFFRLSKQKIKTSQEITPTAQPTSEEKTPTISPTPSKDKIPLKIIEPEDEAVVSSSKLTIKGETSPLATVVVIWEEGEDILVADEKGKFETEIELIGGANDIQISAYDEENNSVEKLLTVTYSTAKF